MSKRIEDGCVNCGLPCFGDKCPNSKITRYFCDQCGDEEDLYYFDDEELCIECIKDRLEPVNL